MPVNTDVSGGVAPRLKPVSLVFSLAGRNKGNFSQTAPATLSSSRAEVHLASLVAWA